MAKNNKDLKNSLICSFFVMLLSGAMLCGTTFAWFSETVQSQNNQIQAGTLQVDLLKKNEDNTYTSVAGGGPVFSLTDWKPGDSKIVALAVKNTGTLQMQYNIVIDVDNENNGLVGALQYCVDGTEYTYLTNGSNTLMNNTVNAGATNEFTLKIHMDDYAPLKYMGKSVTFSISVEAKQATATTGNTNNNANT